jgi:hypothetical protein
MFSVDQNQRWQCEKTSGVWPRSDSEIFKRSADNSDESSPLRGHSKYRSYAHPVRRQAEGVSLNRGRVGHVHEPFDLIIPRERLINSKIVVSGWHFTSRPVREKCERSLFDECEQGLPVLLMWSTFAPARMREHAASDKPVALAISSHRRGASTIRRRKRKPGEPSQHSPM